MTHRERQLAAIQHRIPDRISVDSPAFDSLSELAAFLHVPEAEVSERLGLDGMAVGLPYLDAAAGWTEWGLPVVYDWGSTRSYPLAAAVSTREIEQYAWPDPGRYDYARAAAAARQKTAYAIRGPGIGALFHQTCCLMGAEAVLSNMLEAPAVFEAVLERVFQVTCECLRRWIACCGSHFDILSLWDDFATQRGMLFAPELWRQFLKPRYAELFRAGKEKGLFVWFHSCGDITPVLPDLIDIGMDVWETVQLHALPVPAEALKRDYGRRLTFFGGINTQRLPFARPADVAREVERCIAVLGKGGGYICGPDHRIKLDVPPANTAALFRAATSFRAAGYTVEN